MAKIGRPIKFVIRLTPEERTRLDGMIHCGKGSLNSALKARILLKADVSQSGPGCGMSCNNDPLREEISSKFAPPPLVVETPSHRAAMERQPGMICIEKIGMVRPASWSGCGSSPTVLPSRRGGALLGGKYGSLLKVN